MPPKVTVKGLAKAVNEYLDSMTVLVGATRGNSVTPHEILKAETTAKKLHRLMKEANKEAKDGTTRRHSQKKTRTARD